MRTTRLVYIAHPLGAGADRTENIARASRWVAWAALAEGVLPVASWIVLASVWTEAYRDHALMIDCQTIARCDEVWLCGPRTSPGMAIERDHADRCGILVRDFTQYRSPDVPRETADSLLEDMRPIFRPEEEP